MEIRGKIIVKLPLLSGTSKAGNAWTKQEYVLETLEAYPKKVHFDFFGEKASQFPLEVGDLIDLSYDIESREYNNRWYTSIRGWKAEKVDPNAVAMQNQQAPVAMQSVPAPASALEAGAAPAPTAADLQPTGEEDDLPF